MSFKYVEELTAGVNQSAPPLYTNQEKGTEIQPNGLTPAVETQWGDIHNSHGRSLGAGTVMTE